MAKSRVQGITLEFGADFADVEKGLKTLNAELGKTQSDLRDVDKLLKLDPDNVELAAQKERLLTKATEETRKKLQALKQAQDKMRAATKNGTTATQEQQRKMDALEREIAQTSAQLKKYERAMDGAADETKDFAKAADDAGGKAGGILETLGKYKGAIMGGAVVGGITAAASALSDVYENSKELRMDLSKLEANAKENGATIEETKNAWREFSVITGETDSSVEAVSNLLQARLKGNNLERALKSLGGAVTRFPDTMKVESLADSLQETLVTKSATGQYAELLERCGVNLDKFNAGLAKCKTDAEAQNYALQELEKQGLAQTYEAYKENNKELLANNEAQIKQQEALAELGAAVEPFVTAFAEGMTIVVGWLKDVVEWTEKAINWLGDFLGVSGDIPNSVKKLTENIKRSQKDVYNAVYGLVNPKLDTRDYAGGIGASWNVDINKKNTTQKTKTTKSNAKKKTTTQTTKKKSGSSGASAPERITMQSGGAVYSSNSNSVDMSNTFNVNVNGKFTQADAQAMARMVNTELGKLFR